MRIWIWGYRVGIFKPSEDTSGLVTGKLAQESRCRICFRFWGRRRWIYWDFLSVLLFVRFGRFLFWEGKRDGSPIGCVDMHGRLGFSLRWRPRNITTTLNHCWKSIGDLSYIVVFIRKKWPENSEVGVELDGHVTNINDEDFKRKHASVDWSGLR